MEKCKLLNIYIFCFALFCFEVSRSKQNFLRERETGENKEKKENSQDNVYKTQYVCQSEKKERPNTTSPMAVFFLRRAVSLQPRSAVFTSAPRSKAAPG